MPAIPNVTNAKIIDNFIFFMMFIFLPAYGRNFRTYPKTSLISSRASLLLNEGISPLPLVMMRIARVSSAFHSEVRSVAPERFPLAVLARPSEP
jgi:hypothetical protein